MEQPAALETLIAHYGERFEICRDVDIAGMTVPVVASMRHRGNISILGFGTNKTGPEACEHVFLLQCARFDNAALERIASLVAEAERVYIHPDENHAYTFLSVAVLAEDIEKTAAASLKKYKCRREYGKAGWMLARAAVFCANGESFCNRDGADFKRLVLKVIQ